LQSALGLAVLIAACWFFSENRQALSRSLVVKSLLVQIAVALLLLKIPATQHVFTVLNRAIEALMRATGAGTSFVFGFLGGGPIPYSETIPDGSFVLAFRVLPLIIVVSVLSGLLLYWRILPLIMRGITVVLQRTLGIGGAVGLGIAANAFLGMVESPLLIRPYLSKLGRGELFAVMTAGMATIAGTMLALEAAVIGDVVPNAVGHLLSASLISLPAVVYISHLLVPNTGAITTGKARIERDGISVVDVVAKTTQTGLQVFLSVVAMLIVVVALVNLVNMILGLLPNFFGAPVSVERLLGYAMAPLVWLIGIPWSEALQAGQLMGVKTVLTELIAYIQLGQLPADALSSRSAVIMTYALCGFASFMSVGIMVTGLVVMVPERREEIVSLGVKSLVAGTLVTSTTACIVGMAI
jgi:CNT family concentrative nucleoside transporter